MPRKHLSFDDCLLPKLDIWTLRSRINLQYAGDLMTPLSLSSHHAEHGFLAGHLDKNFDFSFNVQVLLLRVSFYR